MIIRLLVGMVVGSLALCSAAQAQFWGGCRDAAGRPVPDYPNPMLQDIARSTLGPMGEPIIEYNPAVVLSSSLPTRRFFYLHECGHHALGQLITGNVIPFESEQQADCWAARAMRREGLSIGALRQIQSELMRSPGDWMHLPGPKRALNLEACLQDGDRRRADDSDERCRIVTRYVERQVPEQRMAPRQVPCSHCGYTPYGPQCMHAFDMIQVPVTVMTVRREPVRERVCDGSAGDD